MALEKVELDVDESLPVVDGAVIERLKSLEDPADEVPFAKQMINGFLAAAPGMLDSLRDAFHTKSEKDVVFWSHKLAGFSMNVGGKRFGSLCQRIEVAPAECLADARVMETVERSYAELSQALGKV